jgi:hypothetical protein
MEVEISVEKIAAPDREDNSTDNGVNSSIGKKGFSEYLGFLFLDSLRSLQSLPLQFIGFHTFPFSVLTSAVDIPISCKVKFDF